MLELDAEKVVADRWSQFEPETEMCFFGFPSFRKWQIRQAFGTKAAEAHSENPRWAEDLVCENYLGAYSKPRVLSVCCGFGHVERHLATRLEMASCLGVDLAPGAVASATARAKEAGLDKILRYEVRDVNEAQWGEGQFDIIIANGALHHLAKLSEVLPRLNRALAPNGMFVSNEVIGPNFQDHSPRQLELINAAAYLMPEELRETKLDSFIPPAFRASSVYAGLYVLSRAATGHSVALPDPNERKDWPQSKKKLVGALRKFFSAKDNRRFRFGKLYDSPRKLLQMVDPSEGVSSELILPLLRDNFSAVIMHPYGGGILAYALDRRFYRNFDPENSRHLRYLDLLFELERTLTENQEIAPEHAILVARK